jgi:HAD superfamily hydrolase (TIGR01548 family)
VDGVLLDITASIRQVNIRSIPAFLRTLPGWSAPDDLVSSGDIECFKRAGGFNDDWDLTYAAVLLYLFKAIRYHATDAAVLHPLAPTIPEYASAIAARGGWLDRAEALVFEQVSGDEAGAIRALWDRDRIRRIFQEMYAGDLAPRLYGFTPVLNPGPGKVRDDRSLLDLSRLPRDKTLAVLTGRTLEEARVGLEMVGLDALIPLPARGITKDDGFYKPEPWGMRALLTRLRARVALYIGDALDDLRTVLAFRTLPEAEHITLLSAQVFTGTAGPDAARLFQDADILAADVNAVLDLLNASL